MNTGYANRSRRAVRGVGIMAASAALAGAGLLLPATTAQAAVNDLTCAGQANVSIKPALNPSNTSSTAKVETGNLTTCLSPNGHFSQLKSATITGSGPASASGFLLQCPVQLTVTANGIFTWQNGTKSGFTFTLSIDLSKGTVQLSGKVTNGPMTGDTILAALVPTINVDCSTHGLTSLTAVTGAATFVPPT